MISFQINTGLEKKLKNISELLSKKRVELENLSSSFQEAIHRYVYISIIGASTRIENAVLTNTEIDWMDATLGDDSRLGSFERQKRYIEDKLSKDKERSIEEVAGLRSVLTIIYQQAADLLPITERDVRGLHKELLQYYPPSTPYIGRYKVASNSVIERVGNKITREIFKTASPGPITVAAMRELFDWYNQALPNSIWSLPVITEFVYRFLAIHPFQDGNGRLGRALFFLGMLQAPDENLNFVAPYLAVDRQIEKSRAEYYIVLRQCSGGVFRQDPNIVLIGELRDLETIKGALTLAETGHLIFGTLHTIDAVHAINRIIDVFPAHQQQQIRLQLSMVLVGVIVQQLIPRKDQKGRVLAVEVMNVIPAIQNLIRENALHQIYSLIQMGKKYEMCTMNHSLATLFDKGIISWEEAHNRSTNPQELISLVKK